ncbi:hypothetical protein [Thiorhodococcus mannitoliphagus]|nr:hypothetical protein [Thiorhodococcus mannitoliphagus]
MSEATELASSGSLKIRLKLLKAMEALRKKDGADADMDELLIVIKTNM